MENTATGLLKSIGDEQRISDKFTKREFVIETQEQYPQFIQFELHQTRTDIIDAYKEGDNVVVSYNLKGRQFTNSMGELKTYNTLVAWKIQKV
jgi:hypothetical protein